jgi:cation diffusion facilitator family transporter
MSFSIVIPDISLPKLSNETLLRISIGLFFAFVIAEIIGAVVSNSLSLLGDAACMSVDILTYLCNIYVEWYKNNAGRFNSQSSYTFEIVIPMISVISLVVVTVYISIDAIQLLNHPPLIDDVNVKYLYAFAVVNLFVDLVCGFLFYLRGEEIFLEAHDIPQLSLDTSVAFDSDDEFGFLDSGDSDDELGVGPHLGSHLSTSNHSKTEPESMGFLRAYCFSSSGSAESSGSKNAASAGPGDKKNLNMMSAFTHVLGDTLRTISVFLAALVSTLTGIDGDICDAWAAIIVAVTIVALCAHIMLEIRKAAVDIYYEQQALTQSETSVLGARKAGRFYSSSTGANKMGKYMPVKNEDEDAVI